MSPAEPVMVGPAAAEAPPLERALERVRCLAERRARWLAQLRAPPTPSLELPPALARALLGADDPEREGAFYAADARCRELGRRAEALGASLADGPSSPFARIASTFGLEPAELDLLQVTAAAQVAPELAPVFAHLASDPNHRFVSEPLVARLCGHGRSPILSPSGALAVWSLVRPEPAEPGEVAPLRVDPFVLGFLAGRAELDADLLRCARLLTPRPALPSWPLKETLQRVEDALARDVPTRLTVLGPPGSGRRSFAATLCAALGLETFSVDSAAVEAGQSSGVRRRVLRQALLLDLVPVWIGDDLARLLNRDQGELGLEIVVAEAKDSLPDAGGVNEIRIALPILDSAARAALWAAHVPGVSRWPEADRARLAERFVLPIGDIVSIGARAPADPEAAARLARETTRGRLGELGSLLACPFTRDDLQLPTRLEGQLDELSFEAHHRVRLWEQPGMARLFPRGTGLVALLTGGPGTGKTMAAQVVAAELGLDLYRIDVASMISKYIGETAKNLRRLFLRAAYMNAVLFFDECDALFARRTDVSDAHDRHANADTAYLLQLIEDYPGLAFLATNRRQNLDEAFVRRIRYVLYFPRPDAAQRRRIWARTTAEMCGPDVFADLEPELLRAADTVDATGAQIKSALLTATFRAARFGRPHMSADDMWWGLERELGKQGKNVTVQRSRP